MFFVVNKTKNRITIGDLGLTLGPRQAIDLDKVVKRERSESSNHLKAARTRGDIEIRIKDSTSKQETVKETIVEKSSAPDMEKMKNDIVSELKDSIKELASQITSIPPQSSKLSESDIEKLSKTILDHLPEKQIIQNSDKDISGTEDDLDGETLADMSVRVVNKIVKDTSVESIKCKEEKSDITILGNMKELEDLLG